MQSALRRDTEDMRAQWYVPVIVQVAVAAAAAAADNYHNSYRPPARGVLIARQDGDKAFSGVWTTRDTNLAIIWNFPRAMHVRISEIPGHHPHSEL